MSRKATYARKTHENKINDRNLFSYKSAQKISDTATQGLRNQNSVLSVPQLQRIIDKRLGNTSFKFVPVNQVSSSNEFLDNIFNNEIDNIQGEQSLDSFDFCPVVPIYSPVVLPVVPKNVAKNVPSVSSTATKNVAKNVPSVSSTATKNVAKNSTKNVPKSSNMKTSLPTVPTVLGNVSHTMPENSTLNEDDDRILINYEDDDIVDDISSEEDLSALSSSSEEISSTISCEADEYDISPELSSEDEDEKSNSKFHINQLYKKAVPISTLLPSIPTKISTLSPKVDKQVPKTSVKSPYSSPIEPLPKNSNVIKQIPKISAKSLHSDSTEQLTKNSKDIIHNTKKVRMKNSSPIEKLITKNSNPIEKLITKNSSPIEKLITKNSSPIEKLITKNSSPIEKLITKNSSPIEKLITKGNKKHTSSEDTGNSNRNNKSEKEDVKEEGEIDPMQIIIDRIDNLSSAEAKQLMKNFETNHMDVVFRTLVNTNNEWIKIFPNNKKETIALFLNNLNIIPDNELNDIVEQIELQLLMINDFSYTEKKNLCEFIDFLRKNEICTRKQKLFIEFRSFFFFEENYLLDEYVSMGLIAGDNVYLYTQLDGENFIFTSNDKNFKEFYFSSNTLREQYAIDRYMCVKNNFKYQIEKKTEIDMLYAIFRVMSEHFNLIPLTEVDIYFTVIGTVKIVYSMNDVLRDPEVTSVDLENDS